MARTRVVVPKKCSIVKDPPEIFIFVLTYNYTPKQAKSQG
jgi:hypothetical protein